MGLIRTILVVIWCLAPVMGLPAGYVEVPDDTIALREFDEARLADYKAIPDLQYERELSSEPGPWERFKEWLAHWLQGMVGDRLSALLSRNVVLVLCIVLLILAAIVLGRGGIRRILVGSPAAHGTVVAGTEDIRELDLEALVLEAERNGDLRRAIRLHYLWVLRRLVDKGVLRWSPEHTDHDYALQIGDAGTRDRFLRIASAFQWVWYGDSPLTPERYAELRTPFLDFERTDNA